MKEALYWLRRHEPLASLTTPELERLARASRVRRLESGEMLIRGGLAQTEIIYVVDGATALYRTNRERTVTLLLGVLSSPSIFGDAEYSVGAPWLVSARAETEVTALMIRNDAFFRCVEQNGALAYKMYLDASVRHALANHTAQSVALYPVEIRLVRILLDYARSYGRSVGDDVFVGRKITQPELAAALGVTTKTVRRTINVLETKSIIARDEAGALIVRGISALKDALPENIFGLSVRLGTPPPPVLSRWQSNLDAFAAESAPRQAERQGDHRDDDVYVIREAMAQPHDQDQDQDHQGAPANRTVEETANVVGERRRGQAARAKSHPLAQP